MLNLNLIEKLKLNFRIGRKRKKQSVGIFNSGKSNIFINNECTGFDVGMKDEGEDTRAIDNKFYGR